MLDTLSVEEQESIKCQGAELWKLVESRKWELIHNGNPLVYPLACFPVGLTAERLEAQLACKFPSEISRPDDLQNCIDEMMEMATDSSRVFPFLLGVILEGMPLDLLRNVVNDTHEFLLGSSPATAVERYTTVLSTLQPAVTLAIHLREREIGSELHKAFVSVSHGLLTRVLLPALSSSIASVPDLVLSFRWKIRSWIPFVGMLAPSDTIRIYKNGDRIRFDWTIAGADERGKLERGLCSIIVTNSSVVQVFHHEGWFMNSLQAMEENTLEASSRVICSEISQLSKEDEPVEGKPRGGAFTVEWDVTNLSWNPKTRWWSSSNQSVIAGWNCGAYQLSGIVMKKYQQSLPTGSSSNVANDSEDARKSLVSEKSLTSTLWLSPEFPIQPRHLCSLLDLVITAVSTNSREEKDILPLRQFRSLISEKFDGFPVQFDVPVFPGTSLFGSVRDVHLGCEDASVWCLPESYVCMRNPDDVRKFRSEVASGTRIHPSRITASLHEDIPDGEFTEIDDPS
eukprot:ANDGO_05609.mRNA.1 ankyrin repeat domain 13 isoform 4